jgi:hypothetical protein
LLQLRRIDRLELRLEMAAPFGLGFALTFIFDDGIEAGVIRCEEWSTP